MIGDHTDVSRRRFLVMGGVCVAHLTRMADFFPPSARSLWSGRHQGRIVAQEPFGRLEEIGEGLYALVSTPLGGDYTTVANGGIIAGRDGVLVVEAFQTPEGARWMSRKARDLTGRWPTHLVITHYHGDHSRGLPGFESHRPSASGAPGAIPGEELARPEEEPSLMTTGATRRLALEALAVSEDRAPSHLWADMIIVAPDAPLSVDLGDRTLHLTPLRGHTPSDIAVELDDDGIVWCGDLVWNGMFPNYMDALPSALSHSVRRLRSPARTLYVPGHGPLADEEDMSRYLAVIDAVEEAAREAVRQGLTAGEAAEAFRIPPRSGEWTLFNPSYFRRALEAWLEELGQSPPPSRAGIGPDP